MEQKAKDTVEEKVNELKLKLDKTEMLSVLNSEHVKNNAERLTRHKTDFNERMEKVVKGLEKIENILWEGGLVSTVKTNSEWIKSQNNQTNKIFNFLIQAAIAIGVGWIIYKISIP